MNQLPFWVIPNTNPAFYDSESATAIEQTAKLYGAMRNLIQETNDFEANTSNTVNELKEVVDNIAGEYNTISNDLNTAKENITDLDRRLNISSGLIEWLGDRIARVEGDIPSPLDIMRISENEIKNHITTVKWDEVSKRFLDYDGSEIAFSDLYDIYLKGFIVFQREINIDDIEGNKFLNLMCISATAPSASSDGYTFVFATVYNNVCYKIVYDKFLYMHKYSFVTDGNFPSKFNEEFAKKTIDIRNEIILTPNTSTGTMTKNNESYTMENFLSDYNSGGIVVVKEELLELTRNLNVAYINHRPNRYTRVHFSCTTGRSTRGLVWEYNYTDSTYSIKREDYLGNYHVHLYCDGEGICYFEDKDKEDMMYLSFDEIKTLIEDDNNIIFITNGYYSFYSKYYYHTAISHQDTDAIGFIGETQLNGHAYSWRIAINENNEVTEDEIRLVGSNEMNSYVKESLVNNNIVLTDEEKLKIEAWLGLSENYLTYYNATPYSVNADYVPAHKKYVDEAINGLNNIIGSGDFNNG